MINWLILIVIFLKLHSFYKNYKDMYIFKLFYFVILNQELMPILTFCDFSRPGFNKILTHLNCSYMLNLLGLVKQLSHRKITLSLSVHFLYLDWIRRFTGMSQYRKTGVLLKITQPAITCSKLTAETSEQGMKYVQR